MINKQVVRRELERKAGQFASARELAENVAREMYLGDEFEEVRRLAEEVHAGVLERTYAQA